MGKYPRPSALLQPLILSGFFRFVRFNPSLHRTADIVLAVGKSRDACNRVLRNNLSDEHHASSLDIGLSPADVKAQVDLIEVRVERDRKNAKEFGAEKPEANQT